jgi:hypothetical protein
MFLVLLSHISGLPAAGMPFMHRTGTVVSLPNRLEERTGGLAPAQGKSKPRFKGILVTGDNPLCGRIKSTWRGGRFAALLVRGIELGNLLLLAGRDQPTVDLQAKCLDSARVRRGLLIHLCLQTANSHCHPQSGRPQAS